MATATWDSDIWIYLVTGFLSLDISSYGTGYLACHQITGVTILVLFIIQVCTLHNFYPAHFDI